MLAICFCNLANQGDGRSRILIAMADGLYPLQLFTESWLCEYLVLSLLLELQTRGEKLAGKGRQIFIYAFGVVV